MSTIDNNTENLPEFDPSFSDGMEQSADLGLGGQRGPSFPMIQWINGNPGLAQLGEQLGYTGGFLFVTEGNDSEMSAEDKEKRAAIGQALATAGWKPTTHVFRNGDEVTGYWSRQAAISLVDIRRAWVGEVSGETKYFPWAVRNAYKNAQTASDKSPSSKTHALILVKGAEDAGPLTLTLSGTAGKGFDDALRHFLGTVIAAANKASAEAAKKNEEDMRAKKSWTETGKVARRWAASCFWLPVGADRDTKGKPKFTEVGKGSDTSKVTLPIALGLPELGVTDGIELRRFYVGKPLQDRTREIYEANAEWREAWNSFDDSATPGAPAAHTNGNGAKPKTATQEVKASEDALASLGL